MLVRFQPLEPGRDMAIENQPRFDQELLRSSRSLQVCMAYPCTSSSPSAEAWQQQS